MRLLPRLISALAASICAGLVAFVLTAYLIVLTDSCDRRVHVCDLAPIAGFGIGALVGPVIGLLVGWLVFRRLGRKPDEVARNAA